MKKYLASLLVASFALSACQKKAEQAPSVFQAHSVKTLRDKPMDFGYQAKVKGSFAKNLVLPGKVAKFGVANDPIGFGKLMRAVRFDPLAIAVENRYGLPQHILLAMAMQESGGLAAPLNSGDDGGCGLIHMQPMLAHQFGLKVYQENSNLVDHTLGRELRAFCDSNRYALPELAQIDERFHPLANLDAVGRMLAEYSHAPMEKKNPYERAICRYAGKKNFPVYLKNVTEYAHNLLDSVEAWKVAIAETERLSPNLEVDGRKARVTDYLVGQQAMSINWGLDEYQALPAAPSSFRFTSK